MFLLKNLVRFILLLFCVSAAAFFLVSISPLDPLKTNVGQATLGSMSEEQIQKLETYWGVDIPPVKRFLEWGKDFITGDMGISLLYRQPVEKIIWTKLSNSILLFVFSWVFSGVIGTVFGILAGMKQGEWIDKIICGYSILISSTPVFWIALIFLMIFAVWFPILPIGFSVPIGVEAEDVTILARIYHAVLPAVTLSITGVSGIILHTRKKMIEILESDYVLFAKARGETKWQILKNHGIRNILFPVVTLQFGAIGEIFGGSILVEQVFSYPGLGQAAITAGIGSDIPLLLGITVIMASIVFFGNLIADILYSFIDPRIRKEREKMIR